VSNRWCKRVDWFTNLYPSHIITFPIRLQVTTLHGPAAVLSGSTHEPGEHAGLENQAIFKKRFYDEMIELFVSLYPLSFPITTPITIEIENMILVSYDLSGASGSSGGGGASPTSAHAAGGGGASPTSARAAGGGGGGGGDGKQKKRRFDNDTSVLFPAGAGAASGGAGAASGGASPTSARAAGGAGGGASPTSAHAAGGGGSVWGGREKGKKSPVFAMIVGYLYRHLLKDAAVDGSLELDFSTNSINTWRIRCYNRTTNDDYIVLTQDNVRLSHIDTPNNNSEYRVVSLTGLDQHEQRYVLNKQDPPGVYLFRKITSNNLPKILKRIAEDKGVSKLLYHYDTL